MRVRMSFLVDFDAAAWANVSGQGHPLDNQEDVLEYFRSYFVGSPHSEASGMKVVEDKITIVKAGPPQFSGRNTHLVIRFLSDQDPDRSAGREGLHGRWDNFSRERAAFKTTAKRYMGDRSEFSHKTIESADWDKVHEAFRASLKERGME